jgi:hypothetical protein
MDMSGVGAFCFVTYLSSAAVLMLSVTHDGIREGIYVEK